MIISNLVPQMGKRKANWGARASNYGDNPKVVGGRERKMRHRKEHWERVKVESYTRKNPKSRGTHTVKSHSRRQPKH